MTDDRQPQPDVRLQTPQVVDLAEDVARYVLHQHPERVEHTEGVAERAKLLTAAVPDTDAPLLVAAAWLHDIGYAATVRRTGFHPLDGALVLREMGWPLEVTTLVAHHSGARFVAAVRGLLDALEPFPFVANPLTDAVTVVDQTAGPHGVSMSINARMEDMLTRHGDDSPNARAHPQRRPYLLSAAARVAERLERAGISAEQHRIYST